MAVLLKIVFIGAGGLIIFITLAIVAFIYTKIFKEKEEMDPELLSVIMAVIDHYRRERWISS
jgi:hypothetical protein